MSTRKFEIGDIVIATDKVSKWNQERNGITPGVSGKVVSYHYGSSNAYSVEANGCRIYDKASAFTKATPKTSIEMFMDQIGKAETKIVANKAFIAETKSKIDFMKEVGTDMFDENEFKAYHTLTIIEQSGMSKIEKAKAIASLIAGK